MFGEKGARRALRRYLNKGLGGEARLLARWAEESGLAGASVLEVGGGVGQIQAELVRRGAAQGTIVEVVDAYEPVARELAAAAGISDRTSFLLADLTDAPEAAPRADVVVLRRVVCCSPRGVELLASAAALTRRVLVASYPRGSWWVRAAVRIENAGFALLGREFRVYAHDPAELEAAARGAGLHRLHRHTGPVWESVAFAPT
jgi:magnesium-protoporphyrin O-methyltransferase